MHHGILLREHSHNGILSSRHTHYGMHQGGICIIAYPQRGIRIIAYPQGGTCIIAYPKEAFASKHLHHDVYIMTYPLEDCRISIFVRRHLHHSLNARTSIIMNKFCIPSLHGTSASWILYLHICQEAFTSEIKNLDLHHVLFAFIED